MAHVMLMGKLRHGETKGYPMSLMQSWKEPLVPQLLCSVRANCSHHYFRVCRGGIGGHPTPVLHPSPQDIQAGSISPALSTEGQQHCWVRAASWE